MMWNFTLKIFFKTYHIFGSFATVYCWRRTQKLMSKHFGGGKTLIIFQKVLVCLHVREKSTANKAKRNQLLCSLIGNENDVAEEQNMLSLPSLVPCRCSVPTTNSANLTEFWREKKENDERTERVIKWANFRRYRAAAVCTVHFESKTKKNFFFTAYDRLYFAICLSRPVLCNCMTDGRGRKNRPIRRWRRYLELHMKTRGEYDTIL